MQVLNVFIMGYVTFSLGCYMVCTFCMFTESLLYEHSLDHFVGLFFFAVIFYISEFSFCLLYYFHPFY